MSEDAASDEGLAPRRSVWAVLLAWSGPLMVLGVVGGMLAIATPKFGAARGRAHVRACYANQKTLQGALEMYVLDLEVGVPDLAGVAPALVEGGYLRQVPDDPGGGAGLEGYRLMAPIPACPKGAEGEECRRRRQVWVECTRHGPIRWPPEGSPAWRPPSERGDAGGRP